MAFQASVGTWFAVHMLARLPVGGRFGINNVALPVSLRLETGVGLDDIEVLQSDRGSIHVQCKTSASLSTGATAPLAKTIAQLAQWTAHEKTARGLPDLTRNVGIMAVKADASGTLDNLEAGCRAFDLGGAWAQTHAQRNKSERHALDVFRQFAISGWTESQGTPPTDTDIVDMARLFRITRFSMDEGQSDWREASQLLGRHVYGSDAAGEGALRDLIGIIRALIGSGAPADREGLIRALRQRGHQDTGAPLFEADLQRLEAATATELGRLAAHGKLPLGVGVTITRESDAPLLAAIRTGSLLVVGEPGAGKTGALLHAAHALRAAGEGVVFLSVDRFPGVSIAADLSSELGLGHSLAQVLEATPGAARKFLFIDALDAARGGAAEVVFSSVIQDVKSRLHSQWTVVASMRTFDLRNGRRFKEAFEGAFADSKFADSTLLAVRHFHIPRLSQRDLQTAASGSAELAALLSAAPVRLRELLGNVFNLSLAAQLLATGTEPSAFNGIRTQSGLIDAYEDARLPETALARAAGATASAMLARRQLSVRKVAVNQERLDDVIRAGVLTESGDLVSFAHHVLFDHVLARFHLPWDEPGALVAQLSADSTAALLLAPALRFAVERVWRSDNPNRSASWALLFRIYSASAVDPVLGSVAVRVAVENVNTWEDLGALVARLGEGANSPGFTSLLTRLTQFLAMDVEGAGVISSEQATIWAKLAGALLDSGHRALVSPARILLHLIFEHGDLSDSSLLPEYGRAARALLRLAWADPSVTPSDTAIRFVGKSFASDPQPSRELLAQALREPHFSANADREGAWLAEQIVPIARVDPGFAVDIFAAIFGQTISDDAKSWFGGRPSRILPLSSSRRQDFLHARWRLGSVTPEFLSISPEFGTRAVIEAAIGEDREDSASNAGPNAVLRMGATEVELRGSLYEGRPWDDPSRARYDDSGEPLSQYVRFLRSSSVDVFRRSLSAASRDYATASVWARLLGVGAERAAELADLLWPAIVSGDLLCIPGTMGTAIRFVTVAWASRTLTERDYLERLLLTNVQTAATDAQERWRYVAGRVFGGIPESELQVAEARHLKRELEAENAVTQQILAGSTSIWQGQEGLVAHQLRQSGINADAEPLRSVLVASDSLWEHVQRVSNEGAPPELLELWNAATGLIALIDQNSPLPKQLDMAAWGHVSNAVAKVACSPHYEPGTDGLPNLEVVCEVLDRLSLSPYPGPAES